MRAMVLHTPSIIHERSTPLTMENWPDPTPSAGQLLIRVSACGVCHTEVDEIEGRTLSSRLPIIPGHEVVGKIEAIGEGVEGFSINQRVGVSWFFSACGKCRLCLAGLENLCPDFQATGRDANGGYAEFMLVPASSVVQIPPLFSDIQAAPLLCAGAIGYRAIKLSELKNHHRLGLTGFGASAHLILQLVKHQFPGVAIFVFARKPEERDFARSLGATWAGDTADNPPEKLDVIIDTTPAWSPIKAALENLSPGGRLVINAIRKEDQDKNILLEIDYSKHLWMEKEIKSVANICRADVRDFLTIAAEIPLLSKVQVYPFDEANKALVDLKMKAVKGAKVLLVS